MFCTRCGNKMPVNSKICPHCHYSEDIKESNDLAIDIENTKVSENRKPSYFFRYISFVLIAISLLSNLLYYYFFGFKIEYFIIAFASIFILMIGSYMLIKSLINIKSIKTASKISMILGTIFLITSFITLIFKINNNIMTCGFILAIEFIIMSLVFYVMNLYVK